MTAQALDTIDVDGVTYAIPGGPVPGLFDPRDHGLEPAGTSTATWRGYLCAYAVDGDALRLRRLRVGTRSRLRGAPIEAGAGLLGAVAEADDGWWAFGWEALDVAYTGTLRCAAGFVQSTYVHLGYAPAWKFETVLELAVDAGRVTGRTDRSAEMASIRASGGPQPPRPPAPPPPEPPRG